MPENFESLLVKFVNGESIEVSESLPSQDYVKKIKELGGIGKASSHVKSGASPAVTASMFEFVLEGLHLNRKLNKEEVGGRSFYRK